MKKSRQPNKFVRQLLPIAAAFAFTAACGSEATSLIGTAEAAEGIAAFLEKRRPDWTR